MANNVPFVDLDDCDRQDFLNGAIPVVEVFPTQIPTTDLYCIKLRSGSWQCFHKDRNCGFQTEYSNIGGWGHTADLAIKDWRQQYRRSLIFKS